MKTFLLILALLLPTLCLAGLTNGEVAETPSPQPAQHQSTPAPSVSSRQTVTERRELNQYEYSAHDWVVIKMLAKRLQAESTLNCRSQWGPMPCESSITQTYGQEWCDGEWPVQVFDPAYAAQRWGKTFWRTEWDFLHVEKAYRNGRHNWIVSTGTLHKVKVQIQTVTVQLPPVPICLPPLVPVAPEAPRLLDIRQIQVTLESCPVKQPCQSVCQPIAGQPMMYTSHVLAPTPTVIQTSGWFGWYSQGNLSPRPCPPPPPTCPPLPPGTHPPDLPPSSAF